MRGAAGEVSSCRRAPRRVFLLLALALGAAIQLACAASEPGAAASTTTPTRVVRGERLTVEIMDPNHPERYHRGERFSPVANVLRVRMDGVDFLHAPEDGHDPYADNGGLAMEFDNAKFGPPGFLEAKIGEGFVKVGVGVLRKADELYHYGRRQEVIERARTEVGWREDGADFRQVCAGVNGYAYTLDASVRIDGPALEIMYRLSNTGARRFSTRQYAHNYFRFGLDRMDGGLEVEFPFDFDPVLHEGARDVRQAGRTLIYPPLREEYANVTVPILYHYWDDNVLLARHRPTGRAILARTSMLGPHVFIHQRPAYISPEQFVVLRLLPGESAEWRRRYVFIVDPGNPSLARVLAGDS